MEVWQSWLLALSFFLIALLYSSVGHGGASGYLALLSFFFFSPAQMTTTALFLNCLVAGISFLTFTKAGYFSSRLILPFLVASVPAAFLGGFFPIPDRIYSFLLALALLVAAVRLFVSFRPSKSMGVAPPSVKVALPVGAGIGWLSGIVGVGGGIFLSPLLLLLRWADPKETAAAASGFIMLNSLAGLAGRWMNGGIEIGALGVFMSAAFLGGLIGARLGANHFSGMSLRRLLGVVLIIASAKLIVRSFS